MSRTFHGRDLFSPAAAHLAAGVAIAELGPPIATEELVRLDIPVLEVDGSEIRATVLGVDRFGNVSLNLTRDEIENAEVVPGTRVEVVVNDRQYFAVAARTFADARPGDLILYEDSYAYAAIAVSGGSAGELLAVDEGSDIVIRT